MIDYSLNSLYKAAGITKQGVWDHFRREQAELDMIERVIGRVDKRRKEHPGEGLEKLYDQLNPQRLGRDKFCRIFGQLGYGIRRATNPIRTTIPAHKVFDNLIEGRVVSRPNQIWQSDITYIQVADRFYYLTFILDVYTRRIVGYAVSDSLRAEANIRALQMALGRFSKQQLKDCVHHSDRGSQYTHSDYLRILRSYNMRISMGGKAQDNAFAERVNGIIKNEYLIPWTVSSFAQLKTRTQLAVNDYNTKRHHRSLGKCCPIEYEKTYWKLPKEKRKQEFIRSENTPDFLETNFQSKDFDTTCQYPYCTLHLN